MLRIAICDDEECYLNQEDQILNEIFEKHGMTEYVIDRYESGEDLLNHSAGGYDLLFLDISMKGIDGMETARKLREQNVTAYIVFVTSYIDYAVEGYRVDAFWYILKDNMDTDLRDCLDVIFNREKLARKFMQFSFREGDISLRLADICYIENYKHWQTFHVVKDGTMEAYHLYGKIETLAQQLEEFGFMRVIRGVIVNLCKIKTIRNYSMILQDCNVEFQIPRDKYQSVKRNYLEIKERIQ